MNRIIRFLRSLRFAISGLAATVRGEPNMQIHTAVAVIVLAALPFFAISRIELLFVLLAIALVWMAELFNTAIEKAVDLVTEERHPLAKFAKDAAAAGVLVAAAFAAAVGLIVFVF